MRSKSLASFILACFVIVCCVAAWPSEVKFKLAGTAEFERSTTVTIDVDYTGTLPPNPNPFRDASSWKVFWSANPESGLHAATVVAVDVDIPVQKIRLQLAGDLPPAGASWSVLFNPSGPPSFLPQVIAGTPTRPIPGSPESEAIPSAQTPASPAPAGHLPAKKDCASKSPEDQPFFCPAAPGATPDLKLTASFLAAGGTKPIYALSLKGALQSTNTILDFHPAIATDIEINQNLVPPTNSTTFNPNSIVAGFAFTRFVPVQSHQLYGIKLLVGFPSGEFCASDPSANIIFSPTASFVLNSWQPRGYPSLYATLYPFLGVEIGRNLSNPSVIQKIPINLSNYDSIVRGVLGTDAAFVVASPDRKGNVFSINGTYRMRLPAFDEPEVRTLHQVTTVDLSTKARNWVESDINWAPWTFKYLSITAKYQYGQLPPLFKLVDHSFTLGLTLQASQTRKTK
ncbi:MAG: hypothetical protein WBQ94_22225 [Terracidiphilus sp.]